MLLSKLHLPHAQLSISVSYREVPHQPKQAYFVRIVTLSHNISHDLLESIVVMLLCVDLQLEDLFEEKGEFLRIKISLAILVEALQYYLQIVLLLADYLHSFSGESLLKFVVKVGEQDVEKQIKSDEEKENEEQAISPVRLVARQHNVWKVCRRYKDQHIVKGFFPFPEIAVLI